MRQELTAAARRNSSHQPEDSCTDVLLNFRADQTPAGSMDTLLVGHNEDMTRDTIGNVYFVRHMVTPGRAAASRAGHSNSRTSTTRKLARHTPEAPPKQHRHQLQHRQLQPDTKQGNAQGIDWLHQPRLPRQQAVSWVGFVYAGELPTSAFGFNTAGIGFTLNAVFPAEPVVPGIARNFVSRALLEATNIHEAMDIIGQAGQSVGHSYNLMDLHSKRLLNVEVGPGGASSVVEVEPGSFYFHANMYKHLVVRQHTDNSSYHREVRALQLQAPVTAEDVVRILGDTADTHYPIYRHGNSPEDHEVVTLCTAMFDLEAKRMKDDNAGGPSISTWHPSTGDGSESVRPAAGPSWSTTGAEGVRSWSSYQDLYAKDSSNSSLRKKLPTHNTSKESGPDWQILGEAAAEIARFKGQQQTLNNSQPTSSTPGGGGTSSTSRPALQRQMKRNLRRLMKRVADLPGWLLYRYYNWRQDGVGPTSSLNSFLSALWADVYTVMVLSFGENFPDAAQSGPVEEVFDVLVALAGLAGFALALALVEQVVLETNLANVKRGSKVYEMGHYLVLGWAVSQRDLEVLIKLVGQVCCAAAAEGGTTVVVLTMREKLEMEDIFRYALPASQRVGSHLVFRQGSPLLPSDLSLVAASSARATIILSDQSRSRDEADAQSLRVAILLDELDDYRGLKKGRALGHIVVETRTSNAVPLLRYSCSKRVIALPTLQLNARRLARMVKRPFISWVSQRLWAFNSRCSLYIEAVPPELSGTRFRHLPYLYPDGIILGVAHINSGQVTLNPMLDYTLQPDDQLIFCRPTAIRSSEHKPLPQLMTIPELERLGQEQLKEQEAKAAAASKDKDWLDQLSNLDRVDFTGFMSSDDEEVLQQSGGTAGPQFLRPLSSDGRGTDGRSSAASDTTQQGPGATERGPAGSGMFVMQDTADLSPGGGGRVYDVAGWSMLQDDTLDSLDVPHEEFIKDTSVDHDSQQALAQDLLTAATGTAVDDDCSPPGTGAAGPATEAGVHKTSSSAAAAVQPSGTERSSSPAASTVVAPGSTKVVDAFADSSSLEYVPREYLAVDSSPQSILVAGWAELGFMQHLLWELDQGSSCLPPGSEIVFVNSHPPDDTLGAVLRRRHLTNVRVSHVLADPLQRSQLALLPLSRFRAALVLADERWSDPDGDDSNGIDSIDQPS
eukprot:gene3585-3850_t